MVRGRPVRSCTRNLYGDSKIKDTKTSNGTPKKIKIALRNNQSITDYFDAVGISEGDLKDKCSEFARSIDIAAQTNLKKIIEKEEEKYLSSPTANKTSNMTLNEIRSPSTPHRITLCSENRQVMVDVKPEIKNFEKATVAPKMRGKMNNNRLHILEDKPLTGNNHKLTDYFPVRRSVRKTKTTVMEEKQRCLEKSLRNNVEDGLKVCYFDDRGRGVVADKHFKKGDYVVEYSGDLIDIAEAKKREEMYALDQNTGCYMYYFKHNESQYCIDATPESDRLGRLVNHSRNGNLVTRTIPIDGKPRLILIAIRDIAMGEELLYDYGDRSKESLKHHPWLAN